MLPPIKNYIEREYPEGNITQWFGENREMYENASKDWGQIIHGHNGIDIVAPHGTPILATTTQMIVDVKYTANGYGKHIRAVDDKYEYTYGHLSELNKDAIIGQTVKQGQEIGKMGNTGFVVSGATPYWEYNPYAGTHLHFTVRELGKRTKNYVDYPTGRVYIKNYPKLYAGAIDPSELIIVMEEDKEKIKKLLTIRSLANQVISLLKKLIRYEKEKRPN